MSCFQVTLQRPIGALARPADTSGTAWTASAGPTRLIGPGIIRMGFDSTRVIRLVIAMDVSGSMKGEGIAFTRSALRTFLAGLPGSGVEVALVPFESQRVAARFAEARFQPATAAVATLQALPAPANGNTALYSAVVEGLRTLDRPGATEGATVLLLLTDGVNDVDNARDDPGLLGGAPGREQARRQIDASRHRVWLVGVGAGVNSAELQALAGQRANAAVVALDPGALLGLLEQIRISFATQYTLVYGVPPAVASRLGRRPQQLVVHGDSARLAPWRPPLLASPPFQGSADSTLLSPELRILADGGEGSRTNRLIVGIALLVTLVSAYGLLWRLAGDGRAVPAGAPVAAAAPAIASQRPASDAMLRRDVVDAPPRSPQDITNDEAA